MDQLSQLWKALTLANDQGLTHAFFVQTLMTPIVAFTPAPEAWMPIVTP